MKILFVFGTRPEAIKMAPLIIEASKRNITYEVCITGQHREMLYQVLDTFSIKYDYDLAIMKKDQDLFDVTLKILEGIKYVLRKSNPDYVCVHGDTTTSFAAAIGAYYEKIKIIHIEAGLRTNRIYSPWPEEANRQLVSRIAYHHFCPTTNNYNNLLSEGIDHKKISITGNTVIDALKLILEKIKNNNLLEEKTISDIVKAGLSLSILSKKIVLITGHRRENFGEGFNNICLAIKNTANKYKDFCFVYPVHLNPNVQDPVYKILNGVENVFLIKPLEYTSFLYLMDRSYIIMTDSGGIQEEAPSLGKPVLVTRDTTERSEALMAGTVKLVGTNRDLIEKEISNLIEDESLYNSMASAENPYGSGDASVKIINEILSWEGR